MGGVMDALEEHYAAALERCQAERRATEELLDKERAERKEAEELLEKERRERAEERAALLQAFERQLASSQSVAPASGMCAQCQELHAELQHERKTRAEERSTLMRAIKGQTEMSQTEERLTRLRGGDASQGNVTRRRGRHAGQSRRTGDTVETPRELKAQDVEIIKKPEEEQVHNSVLHFLNKLAEARRVTSSEESLISLSVNHLQGVRERSHDRVLNRDHDADANLLSACGGG